MSEHPTLEAIALWVLDEDVPGSVRSHLASCPSCGRTADDLRRLMERARTAIDTEPRAGVIERAAALVRAEKHAPEIVEAVLVEDTEILMGVRGGAADGRILVFRAGDCDVHLQMLRLDDGIRTRFLGQVVGPADDGVGNAVVWILHGGEIVTESITDDLGEFHVASEVSFPLHLEIEAGPTRLRTPPIPGRTTD